MKKVVGHEKQQKILGERIANSNLPAAMIFHGPSGVGKKVLAMRIVQTMNCEANATNGDPETSPAGPIGGIGPSCGVCSYCVRSVEDKNEFVFNLHLEEKKSISVDQVREIHRYLSLRSLARARFVIIDPADALSVQAANSLLKILEEPPQNTYFILITDTFHKLLPTVRSRAQIFGFSKLTAEELKRAGGFSEAIVDWADGRFDVAIQLESEDSGPLLNESLQFLYSLLHESPQDWKSKAQWFFADDKKRQLCFSFWSQALQKKLNGLASFLDWLPTDFRKISFIFENVESLKSDIHRNVDKQLAVESFFYQMRSPEMQT